MVRVLAILISFAAMVGSTMRVSFGFALVTLFPFAANAADISPFFSAGLEFGGDKLVDITYSDGSNSDIRAGRGILLSGGAVFVLSDTAPHRFELQPSLGIKWTGVKEAENGSVDFYRFPIEVLSFYRNTDSHFRIGGGVTYQVRNELKGTKDAALASTRFENALGLVLQGDFMVGKHRNMGFGLRYTAIKYEPKVGGDSVNGSSIGFIFTFVFPSREEIAQSESP